MEVSPFEIEVPAKIVLFGEWAVVEGGLGLAAALSSRMVVSITPSASTTSTHAEVTLRSQDQSTRVRAGERLEGFFSLASGTLASLPNPQMWAGLEIDFEPAWQLREGLGSSSAIVLALTAAYHWMSRRTAPDRMQLWLASRMIVRALQSPRASGLDLAAQVAGGQVIVDGDNFYPMRLEFPPELRILHTGEKVDTAGALRSANTCPPEIVAGLQQSVLDFMARQNWIQAMDEHNVWLERLGVVPDAVRGAREEWKRKGWIRALKTTGAGGGDALLVWTNPDFADELEAAARERGWWWSPHRFGGAASGLRTVGQG